METIPLRSAAAMVAFPPRLRWMAALIPLLLAMATLQPAPADAQAQTVDETAVSAVCHADGQLGSPPNCSDGTPVTWSNTPLVPSRDYTGVDIGTTARPGSIRGGNGTYTITGAGADIWSRADSFYYAYQPLSGDGTFVAQVRSQQATRSWAKAGIMIRDGLGPDAAHASVFVTAGEGTALQHRPLRGASSDHREGPAAAAPYWVRLDRQGSLFTASVSPDGQRWTGIGSVSVSMSASTYVGLAVNSLDDHDPATVEFAGVQFGSGASTAPAPEPPSLPPLLGRGLHYTPEEVLIWRARATKGPYRSRGDAFPGSPAEWPKVETHKDQFMANPAGQLASLPTGSGCLSREVSLGAAWDPQPNRAKAMRVADAAFYSLVMNDAAVRDRVKATLLAQVDQPGVAFGDRSRYCVPMPATGGGFDSSFAFSLAHWTTSLLYAYDYVGRDSFSAAERSKIEGWHKGLAEWMEANTTPTMEQPFVNRYAGDYTLRGAHAAPQPLGWINHHLWQHPAPPGGVRVDGIHNRYNNRWASIMRYVGLVGLQTGDSFLRDRAKLWFTELLRFGVYPFGAYTDFHRGWSAEQGAEVGLDYTTLAAAHAISFVDALARTGDTSLYDHRTTEGAHGTEGPTDFGSGKSYLYLIQTIARYANGTYDRYWASSRDPALRIDGRPGRGLLGRPAVQANVYYRDTLSRQLYRADTSAGMPAWTDPPGVSDWGDAGTLPAPYLMFADMEGLVDPYRG